MSSSTSLASIRRRRGVQTESASASSSFLNSMVKINPSGRGVSANASQRQPSANATQRQPQANSTPISNSSSYMNESTFSSNHIHTQDGIGELTEFKAHDKMNPIQKGDKLMFGIQDIVKIHERKLVQHETQIQNNSKHILEVEEQTIACIEELDTKCENIFNQLNIVSNGNLPLKSNQIDTKEDISSEIKEFILSSTKQAVESQPATSNHFAVLQKEFNDYKSIVDRMKSELASTKDDLTNLKTLVTNVQSMNMELNMSVIKLLNSQNKPDVIHQQTNTVVHEEKNLSSIEITTPIELATDTTETELYENENEQKDLEENTEDQNSVELENVETLDDSSNETHETEGNHEEKNEIKLEIVDQME